MELHEEFREYETMWDALQESEMIPKASRPAPEEYFRQITSSREAIINFIKDKIVPYCNNNDFYSAYYLALGKATNKRHTEIAKDPSVNVKAFMNKITAEYGLAIRDVYSIIRTGEVSPKPSRPDNAVASNKIEDTEEDTMLQEPIRSTEYLGFRAGKDNAETYFNRLTNSRALVIQFILEKMAPYSKTIKKFDAGRFYEYAFAKETNLSAPNVSKNNIVNYRAFLNNIKKFGITNKTIATLIRNGVQVKTVESYFTEITSSKESALQFITDRMMPYLETHKVYNNRDAYIFALAKATNAAAMDIDKNPQLNYKAFLAMLATLGVTKTDFYNIIRRKFKD
jgi:hypothetical protein